jgi:myosin heavy subunit
MALTNYFKTYHWQSKVNTHNVGVEDMVLLRSLSDDAIVENLRKRLAAKAIFVSPTKHYCNL